MFSKLLQGFKVLIEFRGICKDFEEKISRLVEAGLEEEKPGK